LQVICNKAPNKQEANGSTLEEFLEDHNDTATLVPMLLSFFRHNCD